jgi:hypothetical protein
VAVAATAAYMLPVTVVADTIQEVSMEEAIEVVAVPMVTSAAMVTATAS